MSSSPGEMYCDYTANNHAT